MRAPVERRVRQHPAHVKQQENDMKRYEHYCSWDGGGPADPEEDANGDWVRYDDAQAELAALRKDAERYRWLRDKSPPHWTMDVGGFPLFKGDFDAAIDRAMTRGPDVGAA